jgi:hypothetical protein
VFQGDLRGLQLQAWMTDAASIRCRCITIENVSPYSVSLLHLGLDPNPRGYFYVVDDHNLWDQGSHAKAGLPCYCVRLEPGTRCSSGHTRVVKLPAQRFYAAT